MTKIQLRRDTAANWSTNNPTPSAGEPCFETDTGKLKIGDGITAYNSLPYQGGSGLEICDIGMTLYVDEKKWLRRYLNGQILDRNKKTEAFFTRLQKITTLHPSLLCTEEEWQTAKTMSAFGQVGKFVFNYNGDDIVSVRLPRVVNIQGLFDLQNLGMTVAESLPNIKGTIGDNLSWATPSASGAFVADKGADQNAAGGASTTFARYSFNASRSSSTYKDGVPVQQEAIQYPYFIQIATGSETENNIINEIELNNPYSLFDSKYSGHELNNLSWLKSEGQWNAKAVYPTVYDKLLKVYNGTETVVGLSVKLSTETYTDYDFVLNTTDETFRLPLLDGSEDLLSDRYDDLELLASGSSYTAPANGWLTSAFEPLNTTDSKAEVTAALINRNNKIGTRSSAYYNAAQVFLPAYKGDKIELSYGNTGKLIRFRFIYAKGNGSLYFYVGETAQNVNLIDAGRIGEQLATKTDMLQASGASMPSNRYIDLTLGASGAAYTASADGYYRLTMKQSAAEQYAYLASYTDKGEPILSTTSKTATGKDSLSTWIAVHKGQTVKAVYNAPEKKVFRFIYAVGSQPLT